jgi:hypothetical protein
VEVVISDGRTAYEILEGRKPGEYVAGRRRGNAVDLYATHGGTMPYRELEAPIQGQAPRVFRDLDEARAFLREEAGEVQTAGSGENALPGQTLIPGVGPVTRADRDALEIQQRQGASMRGGNEPPGGLFGPIEPDLFDATPVGVRADADGRLEAELKTDQQIDADLAQEDVMIERFRGCVK